MHTDGTLADASRFCRLASRKSADGEKTDGDAGDLFSMMGATSRFIVVYLSHDAQVCCTV